ncbi:hypothetical protein BS50DRAFT_582154 [Corynespora cassiicola Philippines]|uniref:Uncharacterized protein n=1 Tax=Corynespora cassiicola Philippines TaxID=1448308 RepID=A0A2T2PDR0_CORCC|nr:hypothetical protein BS50DRAFT_582154 [Corynespora cassiicola Philippines]
MHPEHQLRLDRNNNHMASFPDGGLGTPRTSIADLAFAEMGACTPYTEYVHSSTCSHPSPVPLIPYRTTPRVQVCLPPSPDAYSAPHPITAPTHLMPKNPTATVMAPPATMHHDICQRPESIGFGRRKTSSDSRRGAGQSAPRTPITALVEAAQQNTLNSTER